MCRDRAGACADGVRVGAPEAVQIADRWHLRHNLGDVVERTVARHRTHLAAAVDDPEDTNTDRPDVDEFPSTPGTPLAPADRVDRTAVRTRQRHADIHTPLAEGRSIRSIGRHLGLAWGTIRRFAHVESPDELLVDNRTGYRPGVLDQCKPYLHQRWNEGCTDASRLFEEIKARGYRGGHKILRAYLHPFRSLDRIPQAQPEPPSVRRTVARITTDPVNLAPEDQTRLDEILAAGPELDAPARHVRTFAAILRERRGRDLEDWMKAVETDDQPALHSFVNGLHRDQDAVTAGLTRQWNSGAVEGHVNRIKMLKRQMFRRAEPDLPRKRILPNDRHLPPGKSRQIQSSSGSDTHPPISQPAQHIHAKLTRGRSATPSIARTGGFAQSSRSRSSRQARITVSRTCCGS